MTPEEKRNLLKEQYKKELREQKSFLGKVEQLKKQQTLLNAIEGLKHEDDTADWLEKLNQETAFMEAKTELAMGVVEEQKKTLESIEKPINMEKLAAEQLIIEMKRQMGLLPPAEEPKKEDSVAEEKTETEKKDENNTDNSHKILGDF